jgi:hypothetical protein
MSDERRGAWHNRTDTYSQEEAGFRLIWISQAERSQQRAPRVHDPLKATLKPPVFSLRSSPADSGSCVQLSVSIDKNADEKLGLTFYRTILVRDLSQDSTEVHLLAFCRSRDEDKLGIFRWDLEGHCHHREL